MPWDAIKPVIEYGSRLASSVRLSLLPKSLLKCLARHPRAIIALLLSAFVATNALPGVMKLLSSSSPEVRHHERGPYPAKVNRQRI